MTRPRKTVNVDEVLAPMNRALAAPDNTKMFGNMTREQAFREGVASAIETILHHAGRYNGFSYLNVDHSQSPPLIPDETRRHYH